MFQRIKEKRKFKKLMKIERKRLKKLIKLRKENENI
jgi:hypothetical protein